ncbi:hypothetical protein DESA109040_19090 [Deinococcus saxicola]|uniref:SDR family NAD(P)-dependent oxidoreductase n=1 Tax=Deinococcus saxicola TaxID=249406 RepID=UPI0039EE5E9B
MNGRDIQNLFDLGGRVDVVSGGNGIGRACALMLAGARAAGGRAIAVVRNVTVAADPVSLVKRAVAELGGLHILVNDAGGGGARRENPVRTGVEDFARVFELNLFSA